MLRIPDGMEHPVLMDFDGLPPIEVAEDAAWRSYTKQPPEALYVGDFAVCDWTNKRILKRLGGMRGKWASAGDARGEGVSIDFFLDGQKDVGVALSVYPDKKAFMIPVLEADDD